jgi:hypothetical protein
MGGRTHTLMHDISFGSVLSCVGGMKTKGKVRNACKCTRDIQYALVELKQIFNEQ